VTPLNLNRPMARKEDNIKKKELKERSQSIFMFFDLLEDINNSPHNTGCNGHFPIGNFIDACGNIDLALPEKTTREEE